MAGHVYSVETEILSKSRWKTGSEQFAASRKYQHREEGQTTAFGVVDEFFVQSGFSRAKNSGAIGLRIINECALWRWNCKPARHNTPGRPTERRHAPNLITAGRPRIINFFPVGRKCVHKLIPFVIRQLKRLTSGSQHHEHLRDAACWRIKRHGVTVGSQLRVVQRLVPLADLHNLCGADRSVRAGPKVKRRKRCCQECYASGQKSISAPRG